MMTLLVTVFLVVFISAMCSLFEAVLYSTPASHIESLAQAGRPSGRIFRKLRDKVDEPITAILSLNTISNTGGAAVAGMVAATVLEPNGKIWFNVLFTLLILFLAEVIPKTIGVIYSRTLTGLVARPLRLLVVVFSPVVWLVGRVTRLVAAGKPQQQSVSSEEIVLMAQLGIRRGVIAKDEALVIENILSLQKKTVGEVMTPRTVLFSLNGQDTVAEAFADLRILAHSRIPVYFEDREDVGGIVHSRDVIAAVAKDRQQVLIESLMEPVHFVLEKTSLNKILKMFLERGEHLFIALDEFGGLAGLITLEDILEEILGREIVDEFDQVTDMRQLARTRREEVLTGPGQPQL